MLTIKKTIVTRIIHPRLTSIRISGLNPRIGSTLAVTKPLVRLTTCVKGRTPMAATCAAKGKDVNGKNVPHKKNMGVRKRNEGKLKKSMLGAKAVKHMAIELNIKPPKNAKSGTNRNIGLVIKPKSATTHSTMVAFIVARVAPQSSSPATTSSTLMGVATMASKVFWKYMRTNEAKVHSKNEPFIMAIATSAGAMKFMYG